MYIYTTSVYINLYGVYIYIHFFHIPLHFSFKKKKTRQEFFFFFRHPHQHVLFVPIDGPSTFALDRGRSPHLGLHLVVASTSHQNPGAGSPSASYNSWPSSPSIAAAALVPSCTAPDTHEGRICSNAHNNGCSRASGVGGGRVGVVAKAGERSVLIVFLNPLFTPSLPARL